MRKFLFACSCEALADIDKIEVLDACDHDDAAARYVMQEVSDVSELDQSGAATVLVTDLRSGESKFVAVRLVVHIGVGSEADAADFPSDATEVLRRSLTETVWLVAEAFGADRDCHGCQKVVRHMDRREHGSVCGLHRRPPTLPVSEDDERVIDDLVRRKCGEDS